MPDLIPVALLGSLVFTVVNFLKYLVAKDTNAVVTQLVAWVAGIAVVFVFAQTRWADGIDIMGVLLASANAWELFVLGLMATSLFSVAYDFKKAFDNSDSAVTPPLTGS